jgi:hypothetical protein
MDKPTWQARIREHLQSSSTLLHRIVPGMTYGALSAASLMPLISTVQGGELAALFGLANIVGGVGSNLIANQIQSWRDHNEAEIAQNLNELAEVEDWRVALDILNHELETPRIVQAILGEAEWDRFQRLLQQELAQLGNLAHYKTYFVTINTEGGTYVEGDVTVASGDFVSGDKITHNHPPAPDPAAEQAAQAEAAYLHMLRRDCNQLPLAEDDRSQTGQNQRRAQLANVYVDLQTTESPALTQIFDRLNVPDAERVKLQQAIRKWRADKANVPDLVRDNFAIEGVEFGELAKDPKGLKDHPLRRYATDDEEIQRALRKLSALETLTAHPHLVLLGEPGGGKSTFVNHLAYIFAGVYLGEEETLPAPLTTSFFPLRVILRRWSSTLTRESKPGLELVYDALSEATGLDREAVLRRLRRPDTLVLFDGLDEAPPADAETGLDRRKLLVLSVQDFCTAHPDCRVLVTSRIKPYDNKSYRLDDLPVVTLAKLDEARIERFVHNWYAERARVDPEKAAKATVDRDRLLRSLSQRPELRRMAETPLLLTMLAAVNAWAGLPESRAELYDKCVEQLLWEWEKRKQDDGGDGGGDGLLDLLHEAGLQRSDLERVLWEMTYAAHAASGSDMADLPARDLREKLAAIHPKKGGVNWAWADRVVALMAERGGLLVETDTGVFSFPHRSFQEYLAARWLLEQEERTAEAAQLAESDTWRETVLLACGALTYSGRFSDVQAIIAELTGGRRFDTPEKRLRLLVGGQAWVEFGPHRARGHTGEELAERVPERLTQLMQDRHAPPRQRLDAGLLVADLHILPPDLDDFVPIAARAELGYDFRITKYPVTNVQFRRFFDQGKGYAEGKPWWTEEAVKDIERWEWNKDWRKGPRLWGNPRFDRETQPVVGVSWYEAVAYCEWLTVQMRTQGKISQNEAVRLPTEDEWVRAARGPHPQPP